MSGRCLWQGLNSQVQLVLYFIKLLAQLKLMQILGFPPEASFSCPSFVCRLSVYTSIKYLMLYFYDYLHGNNGRRDQN